MMNTYPSNNTTDSLTLNEQMCYSCSGINSHSNFQIFRLYLPSFPRNDINAIIEIPFNLARLFAISTENFWSNTLELILAIDYFPEKFKKSLSRDKYPKYLEVSTSKRKTNDKEIKETEKYLFKYNKTEYILNNLKDFIGSLKVEIFHNIPAISRKNLLENCRALLDLQNEFMVKLIGWIFFKEQNLFLRISENFCLDLEGLKKILVEKKDIINNDTRVELFLFILAETLVALDNLHERGITHRFLCPKNIIISWRGHIKIGNIYEAMNTCRDLMKLYEKGFETLTQEIYFNHYLNPLYQDPEVLKYLLENNTLAAYMEMDCLSDVFSIGIIIFETITGTNLLDVNIWNGLFQSENIPNTNHCNLVEIYLNSEMQTILRQKLCEICNFLSKEAYAFIHLMLLPKLSRMKGLRMNVQRHRFMDMSGCEYKLRMELVKKHPVFKRVDIDSIFVQRSPVERLLSMINGR